MRNDAHAPSNFDPADYRVIDYIDNKRPEPPMPPIQPGAFEAYERYLKIWQERIFEHFPNWRTGGDDHQSIHQCNHCGHPGIRWVAVVEHIPTGAKLAFGETCAERVELAGRDAFRAKFIKDRAAREQAAYEKEQARMAFEAANPEVIAFLKEQEELEGQWRDWNEQHAYDDRRNPIRAPHPFILDMIHTYNRYGNLTEKQLAATAKFAAKAKEFAARDAQRQAEREAEVANAPVLPEGRYEIEGQIVSTKWQEGDYNDTLKMLVKMDDGNKVWGTVPENILSLSVNHIEYVDGKPERVNGIELKGQRIRFTAKVTRSKDDEHFGFFKRPTKTELVQEVAA